MMGGPLGGVPLGAYATTVLDRYPPRESVIAFIDVLGFRELVVNAYRDTTSENSLRARRALGGALEMIATGAEEQTKRESGSGFRATAFSDSVVISDDLQEHGIERVLDTSTRFAAALLTQGFACRGGIASGPLVHRQNLLLGPAMNAAYDLERGAAVYPRIVIDDSLSLSSEERPGHWRILRDQDGFRFLDIFYRIRAMDREDATPGSWLERTRMLIQIQNDRLDLRPREMAKWRWLSARFKVDTTQ